MIKYSTHSSYQSHLNSVASLNKVVDSLVDLMNITECDYDAIYVSGLSGVVVGSIVANKLGKHLIIDRKTTKGSHAHELVEGLPMKEFKYIILDDGIASGSTMIRMTNNLLNAAQCPACTCSGILLFWDSQFGLYQDRQTIPTTGRKTRLSESNLNFESEKRCKEKSASPSDSSLKAQAGSATLSVPSVEQSSVWNPLVVKSGRWKGKQSQVSPLRKLSSRQANLLDSASQSLSQLQLEVDYKALELAGISAAKAGASFRNSINKYAKVFKDDPAIVPLKKSVKGKYLRDPSARWNQSVQPAST